jgi:hypothetical protein
MNLLWQPFREMKRKNMGDVEISELLTIHGSKTRRSNAIPRVDLANFAASSFRSASREICKRTLCRQGGGPQLREYCEGITGIQHKSDHGRPYGGTCGPAVDRSAVLAAITSAARVGAFREVERLVGENRDLAQAARSNRGILTRAGIRRRRIARLSAGLPHARNTR